MKQPDNKSYQAYYYASARRVSQPPQPSKRHHRGRWLLTLILLAVIVIVGRNFLMKGHMASTNNSTPPSKSASAPAVNKKTTPPPGLSTSALATLGQGINAAINQNSNIDVSVNLIDLRDNQAEHYGVSETFMAASTAKILTAEYFLHQVEIGHESLGETINGRTAQYEMQQMIVISDDTAWDALNNRLGYTNLQNYAASALGITDYQAYNNILSSGDIALALQKLWEGSLLNSSDTQLLLSYLQQANYRQYIVPAVPSDDTIYHKIGFYEDYLHDAAIITHGQQAFVIVVFTNGHGAGDFSARGTMMQSMTKAALSAYFGQ